MPLIKRVQMWTLSKEFEADTLEDALKMAEKDESLDWQDYGDLETSYYLGESNG